ACLARVIELTSAARGPVIAAAATEKLSHLTRRVDALLDQSRHTGTRLLKARFGALAAAIAGAAWIAAHAPGMIVFAKSVTPAMAPIALVQSSAAQATDSARPSDSIKPAPQEPPHRATPPARSPASVDPVRIPVVVREPRNRFVTGLDK